MKKLITAIFTFSLVVSAFAQAQLVISKGTKKISAWEYAQNNKIKAVTIPDSVTEIEDGAFWNCQNLKTITFGGGVREIKCSAFYGCTSLEEVVIPEGVTSIDSTAFSKCTKLRSVTLPTTLRNLEYLEKRFMFCPNLEEINVKEGNKDFRSVEGVLYRSYDGYGYKDGYGTIRVTGIELYMIPHGFKKDKITIPADVNKISVDFSAYPSISEINVEEGNSKFKSIDGILYSKDEANKLFLYAIPRGFKKDKITIPADVNRINADFSAYPSISEINVEEGNADYKSIDGILYSADGKTLEAYPPACKKTNFEIPETVSRIGYTAFAFKGCKNLEVLQIPQCVKEIGYDAFKNSSIKMINYCNSKESWNKEIPLPEGCTVVYDYDPVKVAQLAVVEKIRAGEKTAKFKDELRSEVYAEFNKAVKDCKEKIELDLSDVENMTNLDWIEDFSKISRIFIPASLSTLPENSKFLRNTWLEPNENNSQILIKNDVVYTDSGKTYYGFLGSTLTSKNCAELNEALKKTKSNLHLDLSYTKGVTDLSWLTNLNKLKSIALPESLSTLPNDPTVFKNISVIPHPKSSLIFEENGVIYTDSGKTLYWIEKHASSLIVKDGCTKINACALFNCTPLSRIELPESLTYVGYAAFNTCTALKEVHFKGSKKQWKSVEIDKGDKKANNKPLQKAKMTYAKK